MLGQSPGGSSPCGNLTFSASKQHLPLVRENQKEGEWEESEDDGGW